MANFKQGGIITASTKPRNPVPEKMARIQKMNIIILASYMATEWIPNINREKEKREIRQLIEQINKLDWRKKTSIAEAGLLMIEKYKYLTQEFLEQ